MLAARTNVAGVLRQWVQRAYIELKYLPCNSKRRKRLAQAAYVTETLVRAAHNGETFVQNPMLICARIEHMVGMIELNQGSRHRMPGALM